MSYFTWKDDDLTNDCQTLEAMARRFEEAANLMKKMKKEGFILEKSQNKKMIKHLDANIFESWGFINEEPPYKQLTLISSNDLTLQLKESNNLIKFKKNDNA